MRAHTVRCASRSTVTEPFAIERFTRQLHDFLSKKKQQQQKKKNTAIGQSKNPRTVSLEEKDSCRIMRQENSGEIDKR